MNLVSSNGETWRKHRRIIGPSFNNQLWELRNGHHQHPSSILIDMETHIGIKWSGQRPWRRTMKWYLRKGGLIRTKSTPLLLRHLPSRYVNNWVSPRMVWFLKPSCRTPQLAALIIGRCGFGFSFDWLEPARSADGKMTIQHALRVVSESTMVLLFVPKWLQRLPILGYVSDGISSISRWIIFLFPSTGWQKP